ncbi:MAG TPA: tetratricopeptide repeat protein [Candidatus Acidoferrales bacterium]|jgi:tetratricopeptide (TPR) repeat protein|nr:tetratricopeptide repeat protein [Candidatus Acidoferrales bacterium]
MQFNPDKTAEHGDAVGVGEGEPTADFEVLGGLDASDLAALPGNFQLANGMRIGTGRNRMMLHTLACLILLLASHCAWSAAQSVSVVDSAHELFNQGRYAQARAVLAPEAAKGSNDADVYYWMAKSDFEMRDFDDSIYEAERAITLNPNTAEYHRLLGEACGRKAEHSSWFAGVGLAKRTRAELEHAAELDPRNVPVRRDLVNFYTHAPGFVGGGEQKALDEIQQVFALDPVEGHLARLDYDQERKQWDQADQECKSVLAAKPRRAGPYYEVASYYEHRDNGAALRLAVTEGRQNAGDTPRFDYYCAVAAVLTGDLDDAEAELKRYLAVPPHSDQPSPADAHVWLGRLYEKQGNHAAALAQFQEALKDDPNNKAAREAFKHEEK